MHKRQSKAPLRNNLRRSFYRTPWNCEKTSITSEPEGDLSALAFPFIGPETGSPETGSLGTGARLPTDRSFGSLACAEIAQCRSVTRASDCAYRPAFSAAACGLPANPGSPTATQFGEAGGFALGFTGVCCFKRVTSCCIRCFTVSMYLDMMGTRFCVVSAMIAGISFRIFCPVGEE